MPNDNSQIIETQCLKQATDIMTRALKVARNELIKHSKDVAVGPYIDASTAFSGTLASNQFNECMKNAKLSNKVR